MVGGFPPVIKKQTVDIYEAYENLLSDYCDLEDRCRDLESLLIQYAPGVLRG